MKHLAALFLLAGLSLGIVVQDPQHTTVDIMLMNGRMFKGEVIAVRESTVVLATRPNLAPMEMLADRTALLVVPFPLVRSINLPRSTHSVVGGLIGAPLGCMGGYAIGAAIPVETRPNDTFGCAAENERNENKTQGAMVGTLLGTLAGCAIGYATGAEGQALVSPEQRDFSFLREVARYPEVEPDGLQKIVK